MKFISTPNAPIPAGHYSQAVVYGGLVYVAGQLPLDPSDPSRPPGNIEEQAGRALANCTGWRFTPRHDDRDPGDRRA